MSGFDIPFSPLVLLLWAGLTVALAWRGYARLRGRLRGPYLTLLGGLRLLTVGLAALVLARPFLQRRVPDPEQFTLAVLADGSGSMRVRDLDGERRLDGLIELLEHFRRPGGLLDRHRVEAFGFADRLLPLASPPVFLPGGSGLGTALEELLGHPAFAELGAVLLISDGNSNVGVSPQEVAKAYRRAGVPISCLGVGRDRHPPDVGVETRAEPLPARRGSPVEIAVRVGSTFPSAVDTELVLFDGAEEVGRQAVHLPPGPVRQAVAFTVTPYAAGPKVYRLVVGPVPGDVIPETDVGYVALAVDEPETFRVLFLAGRLDWDYPLLKRCVDGNRQLEMAAVIRLGTDNFHQSGPPFDDLPPLRSLPGDLELLGQFNAVILGAGAIDCLDEAALAGLTAFVDRRGGGLLAMGGDSWPAALARILPTASAVADHFPGEQYLTADTDVVFPTRLAGALLAAPGPAIPAGFPIRLASSPKAGARAALALRGSDRPVLSTQHFGAGRTAWMGFAGSWRWRLASEISQARHNAFWENLLTWLASTSLPRLQMPADGVRLGQDEQAILATTVLGRDYRPLPGAQVTALIRTPDGELLEQAMSLAGEAAGRFELPFTPTQSGEHGLTVRAVLPDGEELSRSGYFVASPGGGEMADPGYREDVLRDLARISGGAFVSYRDALRQPFELPVGVNVPRRVERLHWAETAPFLALLLATLAGEWYARRRIGLK